MRIGVDDGLQLSFVFAVPPIAVRVVTADEAFIGAAHIGCSGGIGEAERRKRPGIAGCGPAPRRGGAFIGGKQVMRVAKAERRAALGRCRLFPAGKRRLRIANLVGRQAIEKIIAGVEFADMIEAQKLPAAFAAGKAIRARRAEFAGQRAAGMVAPRRIGALDAAVQTLRAFRRFGRFGGNGGRFLAVLALMLAFVLAGAGV